MLDAGTAIGAVERDTGLSKDTLRVWERRYGFPQPKRDAFGERVYSAADVDKLRVIKRLLDRGHRPGKIIVLPLDELHRLAQEGGPKTRSKAAAGATGDVQRPDLDPYVDLVKAHQVGELRNQFGQAVLRHGLAQFVTAIIAPLNERIGEAWTRGYLQVFEEHLYTESVQAVLRNAITGIPASVRRPNILLTTFPQESHGIGILMAEAMLALEGCRCVSLGTRTPIGEIVLAAQAHQSDVLALSFSSSLAINAVLDGLAELRMRLPAGTEIWAGGTCEGLHRRPPAQVRTFRTLEAIAPAVAQWRAAHEPAANRT